MTTLSLGNTAPLMADGTPAGIGNTITDVTMRPGWDDKAEVKLASSTANDPALNVILKLLADKDRHLAIGVLEVNSLWTEAHSADPPEWVECPDNPNFARVLADWFSGPNHECVVGRPDGWRSFTDLPPLAGGAYGTNYLPEEFSEDFRARWRQRQLLTNGGRDSLHKQHLDTAAQPAAFNYMALSANATAESASNTTLPGEITTAGGGLLRAQATFAHTNGTNTSTLTKTFTANGSDALPVTVAKIGVLNAASVGTLGYEKLLSSTATLSASGDNVAVTFTLTAG